ncbi:MAG: AbrB/MazE/SpoVT family DNA-binding domain-containing protein [Clostridiales bacterium]|nr:AbrB/MazE/SpoVT family DNA-binding domain-containing protein [Clostridiales bacterium]
MNITGIVRRVDELGRIVIPKELRRILHIREGEEVEIIAQQDGLFVRKYSSIKRLDEFADDYAAALLGATGNFVVISDKDEVVSAAGDKVAAFKGKPIQSRLERLINSRNAVIHNGEDCISITGESANDYVGQVIVPVVYDNDSVGAIIMLSTKSKLNETDLKICNAAALFLSMRT